VVALYQTPHALPIFTFPGPNDEFHPKVRLHMTNNRQASTIAVDVILFAAIADACGRAGDSSVRLNVPAPAVAADVWSPLAFALPDASDALSDWRNRVVVAINERIATDDTPLHDGDTVALLPPVSGG